MLFVNKKNLLKKAHGLLETKKKEIRIHKKNIEQSKRQKIPFKQRAKYLNDMRVHGMKLKRERQFIQDTISFLSKLEN